MTAMWLIGVVSKEVRSEYFKLVFMKLFQFDALKTLKNYAQFSMKYDLFVIVYISMSVPLLDKSKVCFVK